MTSPTEASPMHTVVATIGATGIDDNHHRGRTDPRLAPSIHGEALANDGPLGNAKIASPGGSLAGVTGTTTPSDWPSR